MIGDVWLSCCFNLFLDFGQVVKYFRTLSYDLQVTNKELYHNTTPYLLVAL